MPRHRPLLIALALLSLGAALRAQPTRYTLDDSRGFTEAESPEPGSDEALIAQARGHLADDQPARARTILDGFLERNKNAEPSALLAQAYLLRGDARLALGKEFKALYDYEVVIREYPGTEEFRIAVERELEIARLYAGGLRLPVLGMRLGDSSDLAVEAFIRVQERMPGSQLAEQAAIELADFYYSRRDTRLASEAYRLYLENFPTGPSAMHASERLIKSEIARFKGPQFSGAGLIDAQALIRDFERRYPVEAAEKNINSAMSSRIDESLGASMLESARWYLRRDDEASARIMLRRLVDTYPRTLSAQQAMQELDARGWSAPPAAPPIAPPEVTPEASPEVSADSALEGGAAGATSEAPSAGNAAQAPGDGGTDTEPGSAEGTP